MGISKKSTWDIIHTNAQDLTTKLNLDPVNIIFHVVTIKEQNKTIKSIAHNIDANTDYLDDSMACTMFNHTIPKKKRTYHIVFYPEKLPTKKKALSVLLHELLHIKYRDLEEVLLNTRKSENIEEKFVLDLENFFIALL